MVRAAGPRGLGRLRSLLFAPAVRPDLVAKLGSTGADGVVIDCEDATPAGAKAEGRAQARALGGELVATAGPGVFVRVNSADSTWFADDVAGGLPAGLAAMVLPKVERREQLDAASAALDRAGHRDLGVLAGLETALGVADARELLAHPRIVGAYFGAEDYIADLGGVRTESNVEVLHVRSHVALAGRLAGVPTLDQIVAAYRDAERYRREAAEARALGFAGKLCIHPGQVALANAAFTPSDEEVARARALLAAYEEAVARGLAAIAFEGQMVDEPLAAQARRLLAAAEGGALSRGGGA